LTTEERLSDVVEILRTVCFGLMRLLSMCSHIGSCAALAHVASWHT
jgi:hypothetical protein